MVAAYNPIATIATISAVLPTPLFPLFAISYAVTQPKFQLLSVAHQTYDKQQAQPKSILAFCALPWPSDSWLTIAYTVNKNVGKQNK